MGSRETLDIENLEIGIPKLGKRARRRQRKAKGAPGHEQAEQAAQIKTQEQMCEIESIRESAWCPPAVPSYEPLPIPPLGSSGNDRPYQQGVGLGSIAPFSRQSIPVHQPLQANDALQKGAWYRPIDQTFPAKKGPKDQALQTTAAHQAAIRTAGAHRPPTIRDTPKATRSLHKKAQTSLDLSYDKGNPSLKFALQPSSPTVSPRNKPPRPSPDYSTPSQTVQKSPRRASRASSQDPPIHLPAPKPTPEYLALARTPPHRLSTPQTLLLILDLNGTLLYRGPNHGSSYKPRPYLSHFLTHLLAHHSLLIWSSAKPNNVQGMCKKLFTPAQHSQLLGEWGRDTLGLTKSQYKQRVQVYKRLDTVWSNPSIQSLHPRHSKGEKWGQHNTLLIDDSVLKASAQPFNLVEVPEYIKGSAEEISEQRPHRPRPQRHENNKKVAQDGILAQVVGYIEEARWWNDVSAFVKKKRFKVDKGWRWDWRAQSIEPLPLERSGDDNGDEDAESDGGVKL